MSWELIIFALMKGFRLCIFIACVGALFSSCVPRQSSDVNVYHVRCVVAPKLRCDSASLWIVDAAYDRRYRVSNATKDADGSLTFDCQLDEPQVAMVQFEPGEEQLLFVLDATLTEIKVEKQRIEVTGGAANHRYMSYINTRSRLHRNITSLDNRIAVATSDTTITEQTVKQLIKARDDADSELATFISKHRQDDDIASKIIRYRFPD